MVNSKYLPPDAFLMIRLHRLFSYIGSAETRLGAYHSLRFDAAVFPTTLCSSPSSAMALSIPVEIWLLIASYVGKEDYDKLINVNIVFFNIIMDNRYREVYIKYIDDDYMRRKLVRLCDPFVASRIRRLHVHPGFNPYSCLFLGKAKRDHWEFFRRLNFFRKDSAVVPYAHMAKLPGRPCVTQALVQSLLVAVKCMSNVTELTVDWPGPIPKVLKPFLRTAWKSFGPRLRSLTLGSAFPSVNEFVLSAPAARLVALEELCLEFGHDLSTSTWESTHTMNMGRDVARFINKLAPRLRHLSISSQSKKLDLCPLFSALAPSFRALHQFSIRAPFPQTWTSNPNALASFLRHNSRTIRSADLVFLPAVISTRDRLQDAYYYERDDGVVASWLQELGADPVALSGLHSLKINPTYSSRSGYNALVSLIRRLVATLTSLTVLVRYMTHEEVTTIVSIFSANHSTDSCNLVTLSLNVRRLDPPLIRLLATNLRGLKELSLRLEWLSQERVEITASNMRGHFYPDWGLLDLGIWKGRGKEDESVLRLIAKAVPSIKSFWGEGSLMPPTK